MKDIPLSKWNDINQRAHEILVQAYEHHGSSIRDFEADGEKGENQNYLKIYGKKEVPEGKVMKLRQNGRTTYFCLENYI